MRISAFAVLLAFGHLVTPAPGQAQSSASVSEALGESATLSAAPTGARYNLLIDNDPAVCSVFYRIYNEELGENCDDCFDQHPSFVPLKKFRFENRPDRLPTYIDTLDIDITNNGETETVIRTRQLQGKPGRYFFSETIHVYFHGHPYVETKSEEYLDFYKHMDHRSKDYLQFQDLLLFGSFRSIHSDYRMENRYVGRDVVRDALQLPDGTRRSIGRGMLSYILRIDGRHYFTVNGVGYAGLPLRRAMLMEYRPDKRLRVLCYLEAPNSPF